MILEEHLELGGNLEFETWRLELPDFSEARELGLEFAGSSPGLEARELGAVRGSPGPRTRNRQVLELPDFWTGRRESNPRQPGSKPGVSDLLAPRRENWLGR